MSNEKSDNAPGHNKEPGLPNAPKKPTHTPGPGNPPTPREERKVG